MQIYYPFSPAKVQKISLFFQIRKVPDQIFWYQNKVLILVKMGNFFVITY